MATFRHNIMDHPEARNERVVGRAGSLCGDCITVYRGKGFKQDPIVVRFLDENEQWNFYCNDVDLMVDEDGFVIMSESSYTKSG